MSLTDIGMYGVVKQEISGAGGIVIPTAPPVSGYTDWYAGGETGIMNGLNISGITTGADITTWDNLVDGGEDLVVIDEDYPPTLSEDALYVEGTTSNNIGLYRETPFRSGNGACTIFFVSKIVTQNGILNPALYSNGYASAGVGYHKDVNSIRFFNGYRQWASDSTDTWYLHTNINNGTYGTFDDRRNGSLQSQTNGANGSNTVNVATDSIASIANCKPTSNTPAWDSKVNGEFIILEFIVYDSVLSTSDIEDVEDYLNDKHSIY